MKKVKKAHLNAPVFSYVDKGVYSAKVFGYEVLFERALHNLWECRVSEGEDAGKLLAVAENRSKAMIEAYNNVLNAEQKRLDWILADEPLRKYGKRGNYNTDIDLGSNRRVEVEGDFLEEYNEPKLTLVKPQQKSEATDEPDQEEENDSRIPGRLQDFLTTEQKLRIRQFYKIRKNHANGKGFFLVKFNASGIYENGFGPYPSAGEAYEKILELEGVAIPDQE